MSSEVDEDECGAVGGAELAEAIEPDDEKQSLKANDPDEGYGQNQKDVCEIGNDDPKSEEKVDKGEKNDPDKGEQPDLPEDNKSLEVVVEISKIDNQDINYIGKLN